MGTLYWKKLREELLLTELSNFIAPYDDIAVDIVSSSEPNVDGGLPHSGKDLAEIVCKILGVEDFDLFEKHDFYEVHKRGVREECLAYAFIAFLRWRVFRTATERGVGIEEFNQKCTAHSEMWYIRLVDTWGSKVFPDVKCNLWIN